MDVVEARARLNALRQEEHSLRQELAAWEVRQRVIWNRLHALSPESKAREITRAEDALREAEIQAAWDAAPVVVVKGGCCDEYRLAEITKDRIYLYWGFNGVTPRGHREEFDRKTGYWIDYDGRSAGYPGRPNPRRAIQGLDAVVALGKKQRKPSPA